MAEHVDFYFKFDVSYVEVASALGESSGLSQFLSPLIRGGAEPMRSFGIRDVLTCASISCALPQNSSSCTVRTVHSSYCT